MSNTLQSLLVLLDIAPELERLLGGEWPTFRDELLALAWCLDPKKEDTETRRNFDELHERLLKALPPEGQELVNRAMPQEEFEPFGRGTRGKQFTIELNRVKQLEVQESEGVVTIPVFYGTDRARGDSETPRNYYMGRRGFPTFGVAHVSVPTNDKRKRGDLTGPSWWQFEPNPEKHVILKDIQSLCRESFVNELRESLAPADARDALIFVHGYNVSFESAARRAAQISVDLSFPGRTLMYSWASAADKKYYTVDEGTIDWSLDNFEDFLRLALTEIEARDVHVIAHSMGNRALVNALKHFDQAMLSPAAAKLNQVVFAAPDIDRDTFVKFAKAFRGRAQRCTLYASSRDLALKASKTLHGYPRAGEAGPFLVIVDGIDTIDASNVDTSVFDLHHSYVGSSIALLRDMIDLFAQRLEPDKRSELYAVGEGGRRYWNFRA